MQHNFYSDTVRFLRLWLHQVDIPDSLFFNFVLVFTDVALMPSVVYLYITLFTELFNLAGGDVPVLVTVSTFVQSQAAADPTFPWSWIMKTHAFILAATLHTRAIL